MSSLKEDLSAFSREDLVYRAKLAEQAERCVLGARCDVRGAMRMRAMVVHAFARERERERERTLGCARLVSMLLLALMTQRGERIVD